MNSSSMSFKNVMLSPQLKLYIKIQLFDSNYKFIKEITQQVKSDVGMLTVNHDSPIRRSFKLTLDNTLGEFIFGENNLIWIDKRIKLFTGLELSDGTVEYIAQGVFVLTDPEDNHTKDGSFTTINAVDKAYLMTDNRGKFINEMTIATGAKITDTIKTLAGRVGETLFNLDNPIVENGRDYNIIPYDLTYSGNDNIWKAIEELATLSRCEVYYSINGYLRLKKLDLNDFDKLPVTWSYTYGDIKEKLYAGNTRTMDASNLANYVRAVGGSSSNKTVMFDLKVDESDPTYGSLWQGNPYSIQKIGQYFYGHNDNQYDANLLSVDDCKYRCKYELKNRLGFDEKIEISVSPNYLHDLYDVISITDSKNGLVGDKYLIKGMNIPLSPALMTLSVARFRNLNVNWDLI